MNEAPAAADQGNESNVVSVTVMAVVHHSARADGLPRNSDSTNLGEMNHGQSCEFGRKIITFDFD